jgi:hypothetical protein
MGTGVNSQIIGTSTFWRFEVISGIILLVIMLPLNYVFTKKYDIVGTATAGLISMTVYNFIRIIFLWKKFNLFPFTAAISIHRFACGFLLWPVLPFISKRAWTTGLFLRSIVFCLLYGTGAVYFRLSPDIMPVWNSIKKRIGLRV